MILQKLIKNLKTQSVSCNIQGDEVHCGIQLLFNVENYLKEKEILKNHCCNDSASTLFEQMASQAKSVTPVSLPEEIK